jgi:uncharacterized protein YdeI (YjbR/CyaY-like superfamily)
MTAEPLAFVTPADWWAWLAAHPDASEVWVLYHKKGSGTPSIDWPQAVEVALAHGWIDGVRKTVDDSRWMQRFTPRKPASIWSAKNVATAQRLMGEGRMTPAGLAAVAAAKVSGHWELGYAGGGDGAQVPQDFLDALAAAPQAARDTYATFDARNRFAIYYRLTTAKRPETRAKRLADFIARLTRGESFH